MLWSLHERDSRALKVFMRNIYNNDDNNIFMTKVYLT